MNLDADEAAEWERLGVSILTESDVRMLEMALSAAADELDYSPFYIDDEDES